MMNFTIKVKTGIAELPTNVNPLRIVKKVKRKLPEEGEEPLGKEEEMHLTEEIVGLSTNGDSYSYEELLPNLLNSDDETWMCNMEQFKNDDYHVIEIEFKGELVEIGAIGFVTGGDKEIQFDTKHVRVTFSMGGPEKIKEGEKLEHA